MMESVIKAGRVAVITGAAKGIGAAAARRFAQEGMRLSLFDRDAESLKSFAKTLNTEHQLVTGDVAQEKDLQRLRDVTLDAFGEVSLLMNNAGIKHGGGPWDSPADWRIQLESNLLSMVTMQHVFVPAMLETNKNAAIVNLGSKEGITTPPGNAAYSVAKAGIKVLTEQLAHELRNTAGGRVTAHLLVPGFTWTDMNFPGMDEKCDEKPEEAWTADQVINYFIKRYEQGDFYIICPDNAVTPEMDARRIAWGCQDIIQNRPALSRWHSEWEDAFTQWMNE